MGKQNSINSDFANAEDGQMFVVDSTQSKGYRLGVKGNYTATTNPTVSDDTTQGYEIGSTWFNTTDDLAFYCLDATTGAAVWKRFADIFETSSLATNRALLIKRDTPGIFLSMESTSVGATVLYALSNGDPNGVVTADRGSLCADYTTGNVYLKGTDATNTGWGTLGLRGGTGATDNAVLRADGAGGFTIQSSSVIADDTGNIEANGISFNSGTDYFNYFEDWTDWTPTISGSTTAGTGTYTIQRGRYLRINKGVFIKVLLLWTAHTGTGQAVLNVPFTVANINGNNTPALALSNNWTGTAPIAGVYVKNSTQAFLYGPNLANTTLDTAATLWFSGFYEVP